MSTPALRVFSYLPNPRLAKATITARLCGVVLQVVGAAPKELPGWLWDFEARPLQPGEAEDVATTRPARRGFRGRLHKTDAFLRAHPFGTVPAAFSPDGSVGVFESNSIMRAVARLGDADAGLYGRDAFTASRIDGFLDVSLVFARESQRYLLALGSGEIDAARHADMREALETWLGGLEQALTPDRECLVGSELTLADVCFATELTLVRGERRSEKLLDRAGLPLLCGDGVREQFPLVLAHYDRLLKRPEFEAELGPYLARQNV